MRVSTAAAVALGMMFCVASAAEKVVQQRVLEDFEVSSAKSRALSASGQSTFQPTVFSNWQVTTRSEVSACSLHATQGRQCMLFSIPRKDEQLDVGEMFWPRVRWMFDQPQDWSGFDAILVDIYNPVDDVNPIRIEIISDKGTASFGFKLRSRSQTICKQRLESIAGKVNLKAICGMQFYIQHDGKPHAYHIDNIRLVKLEYTPQPRVVPPGVVSLQFGVSAAEGFPGVVAVDAGRASGEGWEWKAGESLIAGVSNKPDFAGAMGSVLHSDRPAVLSVNVSDGDYRVYIGSSAPPTPGKLPAFDFTARSNAGEARLAVARSPFAHTAVIAAKSVNGEIDIELVPAQKACWGLSSIVVYKLKDAADVECQYLTKLERDFFAGSPVVLDRMEEQKTAQDNTAGPPVGTEDYLVYRRTINLPTFFNTVPDERELLAEGQAVTLRMAKDQHGALPVSLFGRHDVGVVEATLSAFRNASGKQLPPQALTVGAVRPYYAGEGGFYSIWPLLISPDAWAILEHNQSQTFWVAVHAPEDSPSGIYTGTLQLASAKGTRLVPISIEVLDVRLEVDPSINYGAFIYQDLSNEALWRRKLRDMRLHGWTSLSPSNLIGFTLNDKRFAPSNLSAADKFMKMYKEEGFAGPVINYAPHTLMQMVKMWTGVKDGSAQLTNMPPEFFDALGAWCKAIDYFGKSRGWPDIYQMLLDETTDPAEVEKVYACIHRAGAKTATSSVGRYALGMKVLPSIDIYVHVLYSPAATAAATLHEQGKQLWWNGPMSGASAMPAPYFFRMMYGYGGWKLGTDGVTPWNYERLNHRPTTGVETPTDDWFFAVTGTDAQIPTIPYEIARIGIYDRRAVYTLSNLASKHSDDSRPLVKAWARESAALLAEVYEQIPLDCTPSAQLGQWAVHKADEYTDRILDQLVLYQKLTNER